MNVYIESNFVLEHALQQEQWESCEELIRMSESGAIELSIPAFSLIEPNNALINKEKSRSRLNNEVLAHLAELARSKQFSGVSKSYREISYLLIESASRERDSLRATIGRLLGTSEVIPLTADVLALASENQARFAMSAQDSTVLASIVLQIKREQPSESCFLNRDRRDFDDPSVQGELQKLNCKFFPRFDNGLSFIRTRIPRK